MKAYAIVINNHDISTFGYEQLRRSSIAVKNDFDIEKMTAVIPENIPDMMKEYNLKWNYPRTGSVLDPWTGLRKTAYGERDPLRRMACSLSHYLLWKKAAAEKEPLLILEHDALFIAKLNDQSLRSGKYGIIGINDPHMATFSYERYHHLIQSRDEELQPVPMLVSKEIPQGLAGNSAYIIKPEAASHLLDLCSRYGLWPNDAIMCQQLCNFLGVSRTYYTRVQNLKSTTSS